MNHRDRVHSVDYALLPPNSAKQREQSSSDELQIKDIWSITYDDDIGRENKIIKISADLESRTDRNTFGTFAHPGAHYVARQTEKLRLGLKGSLQTSFEQDRLCESELIAGAGQDLSTDKGEPLTEIEIFGSNFDENLLLSHASYSFQDTQANKSDSLVVKTPPKVKMLAAQRTGSARMDASSSAKSEFTFNPIFGASNRQIESPAVELLGSPQMDDYRIQ